MCHYTITLSVLILYLVFSQIAQLLQYLLNIYPKQKIEKSFEISFFTGEYYNEKCPIKLITHFPPQSVRILHQAGTIKKMLNFQSE